jgi:hypothetical protein
MTSARLSPRTVPSGLYVDTVLCKARSKSAADCGVILCLEKPFLHHYQSARRLLCPTVVRIGKGCRYAPNSASGTGAASRGDKLHGAKDDTPMQRTS